MRVIAAVYDNSGAAHDAVGVLHDRLGLPAGAVEIANRVVGIAR
jgi:hypothetical protein